MSTNAQAPSPAFSGSPSAGNTPQHAGANLAGAIPPHNLEAEQAVLGGIFLRNEVFHELVDIISEDDFYSPVHRLVFQVYLELFRTNTPMDLLTVQALLEKQGKLEEVGGSVMLADMASLSVSTANTLHHAAIVREKSVQRQLINVASTIISNSFAGRTDVGELLDSAEQAIFAIAEAGTQKTYIDAKSLVRNSFDKLRELYNRKEQVTGVPTGFVRLDELTAGLQETDLIIIAGRPAMGKTAFALNVAMHAAVSFDVTTAVFSLEMGADQLAQRLLCTQARINLASLRRGFIDDTDWDNLHAAADTLVRAPLYVDDTPALTTLELRARCRRLKAEKNLGLVVVDYLQLMRASRHIDSREQEISEISRTLKALAKEINVPVVALSQLNRKVEDRTDRRPKLADLRESGAIEQDADLILFLYRDAVYNKAADNPKANIAEVIVGKHRNGPTGEVELTFMKEYTAFENFTDQQEYHR